MTIAIFGGSFNPPHIAHLLAVTVVLSRFEIDRVLVVPTYQHPFAKSLVPYDDRVKMCELAMGWIPRVEISRVEEELGGESRTLRTVEHLKKAYPSEDLRLVMGADIIVESKKWHAFDRIVELAPLIVLGRVGISYEGAPPPILPNISSTDVRKKIAEGRFGELAEYVPKDVLAYVKSHGLYQGV